MNYDKATILSIKLKNRTHLRRLTRSEFFQRLQLIRFLEPHVAQAYKNVETAIWRGNEDRSPHGRPWHVSFHASQFPSSEKGCPRLALYRMMDFAPVEPHSRFLRTTMSAGKGIEMELVRVFEKEGLLLSAGPDEDIQTGFEIPDVWLTASADAIIKPHNKNFPLPIEIKTKFADVIKEMQLGLRGPDQNHIDQLKVQIAFVRMMQPELWPDLSLCPGGFVYYLSRDLPEQTAEFYVQFDEKFWEDGLKLLAEWRTYFEDDHLPSIDPSNKHPMGWKWSYPPCQWCDFKKECCKPDFEAGIDKLTESKGVEFTRKVRGQDEYDPEATRQRVFDEWEDTDDS